MGKPSLGIDLVVWGWSLAGGVGSGPWLGELLLMVVGCLCLFTWRWLAPKGPHLPSVRTRFLSFIHLGVGYVDLLSKKILNNNNKTITKINKQLFS